MKRLLLTLTLTMPLLLVACDKDADSDSQETKLTAATEHNLFNYVPADTPYLFATLEAIPEEVTAIYLENAKPLYQLIQTKLDAAEELIQLSADPDNSTATTIRPTAFFSSILADIIANPGLEGLQNLGLKPDAHGIIYGLGPFPVVRMEIGDETRLRTVLENAFKRAGKLPEEKEFNGRKYWQAGGEGMELIASIDVNEVALSIIPSSLLADALPNILAQSQPDNRLDVVTSLAKLNQNNDYANYGSGWVETGKLLDLFLNNSSSAATTMRQMIDFDAQTVSQICKDEYASISTKFPRVHGGYKDLTVESSSTSFTFELQQELATELKNLVVPKALSTVDSGGLINMGFALNLAKAREWLLATSTKHMENPYQCEQLEGINSSMAQAYENLNRPLPPLIGNFFGMKVKIDDFELNQASQMGSMPNKIKAMFAVLTSNPEMLVGMGQMFLPQLAGMDLTPNADPVPLKLDGLPTPDEPTWAASSKKAIGIAAGEGMDAQLNAFLAEGNSDTGEFLTLGVDSEFQKKMEQYSYSLIDDSGVTGISQPMPSIFKRIFLSAQFTEKGVVFNQETQRK